MKNDAVSRKQAWIVCIACSMIFTALFGLFNNTTALLLSAIADEMGFSNSEISVCSTVKTIATAVFISMSGKVYSGTNGRKWLLLCGVACIVSYAVMPGYTKLWQWYISSAIYGGFSSGVIIISSLVLPRWFDKDKGKAMSVALAPAGLIGMIVNPLLGRLISASGWRAACYILCVAVACMLLPAIFVLYKPYPDGYENEEAITKIDKPDIQQDVHSAGKRTGILLLCVLVCAGGSYYNKMMDFLVQVASVSGYDMNVRATVASCLMFGNLFFKIVSGFFVDRLGVFKSFKVWYAIIITSIILLLIPVNSVFLMCAGAFLFGSSFGLNLIGLPALLGHYFKGQEYNSHMRMVSSFNNYVSAALAFAIGAMLDLNNGVVLLFAWWLMLVLMSVILMPILKRKGSTSAEN